MINKKQEVSLSAGTKRCSKPTGHGYGGGLYVGNSNKEGVSFYAVANLKSLEGRGKGYGSGDQRGKGFG